MKKGWFDDLGYTYKREFPGGRPVVIIPAADWQRLVAAINDFEDLPYVNEEIAGRWHTVLAAVAAIAGAEDESDGERGGK